MSPWNPEPWLGGYEAALLGFTWGKNPDRERSGRGPTGGRPELNETSSRAQGCDFTLLMNLKMWAFTQQFW